MAKHGGNDTQDTEHFSWERIAIDKDELEGKKNKAIKISRTTFSETK